MLERLSVPRRALDFEDYIDILRRNFLWVLGPAFAGLVIATVVAFVMQDTFISVAQIRIVPQQISDTLVQNATTQQIQDHVNAMAENIESRNTLTNLINTYHLYPKEMKTEPLEDVINKMRTAISIKATLGVTDMANSQRSLPAMQVGFKYSDRIIAQKVCDEIVSRFISQNTVESAEHSESANQFMNDETQQAKRTLDSLNERLGQFRAQHAGKLPEQMEMNIQQINALSQQTTALNDSLSRNTERKMLLENNLQIAKNRQAAIKESVPMTQSRNTRLDELDKQINDLQTNIENMKDHYTDDFPDLKTARQQLVVLQHQREQAVTAKPKDSATDPQVARERFEAQAQIDSIVGQIKATETESAQYQRDLANVTAQMRAFQTRVEGTPAGETEYTELIHNRDLAKQHYDELEQKRQRAALSTDLERRKQGETLEVLDAASLPDTPTAPKRPMIISVGPAIGLVLGLILVAIREVKDTSLKNLKDARLYTQLSILGSIPLLENDLVVQRRKQMMWVGWAAATVAGLAVMGITIAHYYLAKA